MRPKAIKAGSKIHPACAARNAVTSSTGAFARKENDFSCGCKLDKEEIEAGREQCFDCYCIDQD
jgi:hypothetical protein